MPSNSIWRSLAQEWFSSSPNRKKALSLLMREIIAFTTEPEKYPAAHNAYVKAAQNISAPSAHTAAFEGEEIDPA